MDPPQLQTSDEFATTVMHKVELEFQAFCSYPDSYIPPLDSDHSRRLCLSSSAKAATPGVSRGKKSVDTRVIQLGEQILQDDELGPEVLCLVLFNSKSILARVDAPSLLRLLRIWNTDRKMPTSLVNASRKWIPVTLTQPCVMEDYSTEPSPTSTSRQEVQSAMVHGPDDASQGCWGRYDCKFSSLADLPHEVRQAWLASGGLPKVFSSGVLHPKGEPFTELGLSKKFWAAPAAKVGVHDGEMVIDAPRKKELVSLMTYWSGRQEPHDIKFNLTLVLEQSEGFHHPMLEGEPIPELAEDTCEVFWVLRGGHTGPHIDHGLKVISFPVGQRKSVFYMWPATTDNLQAFDHSYVSGQSFGSWCDRLKYGIREVVSDGKALLMPTGTIHGVATLSDGFIVTKGHIDGSSLVPMCRWLSNSPRYLGRLSQDNRAQSLDLFIDACLQCPEHAVESVKDAREAIISLLQDLPKATIARLSKRMDGTKHTTLGTAFENMKSLMFKTMPDYTRHGDQINNKKRKCRE